MTIPRIAGIFRLTRDPELHFTQSGKAVAALGIAASDSKSDGQGGWQNIATLFIDANLWGQQAEYINDTCRKGDELFISGTPYTEQWKAKDGSNRSAIRMKAFTVKPIMHKQNTGDSSQNQQSNDVWGSQPSQDFGSLDQPPF